MSQLDKADGSLEFIGEDKIDHTPKDEQVRVKLGSAFDVVGERRQVELRGRHATATWMEEEIEVKLRNHKAQPVDVIVKENLYRWSNWKVLTKTHNFEKEDARTIDFPVKVREGRRGGRALPRALHLVEPKPNRPTCALTPNRVNPARSRRYRRPSPYRGANSGAQGRHGT